MKKMIKKYLISFIAILTFVIGISQVEAISLKKGDKYTRLGHGQYVYVDGLVPMGNTGNGKYYIFPYQFKSNEITADGFCVDPNLMGVNNLQVNRVLPDGGSPTPEMDAAIIAILKNGYSNQTGNTSGFGVSGNDFRSATDIALRAIYLGHYKQINSTYVKGSSSTQTVSSYINISALWDAKHYSEHTSKLMTCDESKGWDALYECFRKKHAPSGSWYDAGAGWSTADGTNAQKVMDAAEQLYVKGLEAAIEYKETGTTAVSTVAVNQISSETTEEANGYTFTANLKVTIKNMPEDGFVKGFKVSASNGLTVKSVEYYYEPRDMWMELTEDIDVSRFVYGTQKSNYDIQIRIKIYRPESENCEPGKYTLEYKYYDPNALYQAIELVNPSNPLKSQKYFALVKITDGNGDSGIDKSFVGEVPCDKQKEACQTEITIPKCSDNEVESSMSIIAPDDIKKCILGNEDDAGNSYKLTDNNGGITNDYCKTFCKEDYIDLSNTATKAPGIKLNPIVENVKCGGAFTLGASIQGKKDCYTGGTANDQSINREKFRQDIMTVQRTMIEGANLILKANAALANIGNVTANTCSANQACPCSAVSYTLTGTYNGLDYPERANGLSVYLIPFLGLRYSYGSVNHSCSYAQTYGFIWENGVQVCPQGAICGTTCEGTCQNGTTIDDIKNAINADRQKGQSMVTEAQEKFKKIIQAYNGCTTAWDNEFELVKQLGLEYAESYSEMLDDMYLEAKEDSLKQETEIEICKGNTDDKYNCTGESVKVTGESSLDEWNYSANYASAFTIQKFTYCELVGDSVECKSEDKEVQISDAKFVRKTEKASQEYITPTYFAQTYPGGKITTTVDYNGPSIQVKPLENLLPIAPNTVGAGKFKISIQDIGEFYDSGDKGRLVDFGGEHESESVANALDKSGKETFNGEYVCWYETTCRPDDCPNCTPVCRDADGKVYYDPAYCPFEPCPDCDILCRNCLFNFGDLQISMKPTSLNNFYSSDRAYGYNWDINTSFEIIAAKANETIKEIEDKNNTIYGDGANAGSNGANKDANDSNLAFSVKMSPDVISFTQEWNDRIERDRVGGYANDSLTCYDANGYDNIFCFSDYIDALVSEFDNSGNVIAYNRTEEGMRSTNPNANNYWTLWSNYNVSPEQLLSGSVIGGPAWK